MSAGQVEEWSFTARKCVQCGELFKVERKRATHCDKCSKQCPDCNRTLPLTEEYWYRKQWRRVDGTWAKRWDTYCRKCKIKRNRRRMKARHKDPDLLAQDRAYYRKKRKEYRERYPEREREYNARRWARIQSDPQAYEDYILNRRAYRLGLKEFDPNGYVIACQDARITPEGERAAKKQRTAVGAWQPGAERVAVEPFREWIHSTFPGASVPEVAEQLGLVDKQVRNIMDPDYHLRVDMRVIDRALVNIGRPDVLNDLYPLREEAGQ